MKRTHSRGFYALVMAGAAAAWMLASAAPAAAYDVSGVGARLGYASPEDLDGTATMSIHAEMEQPGDRLHLMPNIAYWNVDRVRDLNPNFDLYYHFGPEGRTNPYLGGGLGLNFMRDARLEHGETDLGMNVLAGIVFPGSDQSTHHYFLEGRFTASDVNQVSLLTGITFRAP